MPFSIPSESNPLRLAVHPQNAVKMNLRVIIDV